MTAPEEVFLADFYQAINAARLNHLASLVEVAARPGSSVLEVGAGIGELTPFWLDRGFPVEATEGRADNVAAYRRRLPGVTVTEHDLEGAEPLPGAFDIVHAYGVLYHLSDPARGLAHMAAACRDVLFLETCVSYGDQAAINVVDEPASDASQALGGRGCRPTRRWLLEALQSHFPHVYLPLTQPAHHQFPLQWIEKIGPAKQPTRSIFVAARRPIEHPLLTALLPTTQTVFT